MRFPFVSRHTHTETVRMLERQLTVLHDDLVAERARSLQLTNTILDMKMGGATLLRSRADQLERITAAGGDKPLPKSRIHQAIDENKHASRNPALRRHLSAWAAKELQNGREEEEVLEELQRYGAVHNPDADDEDEDDRRVV
jgi:hypothetical protein